MALPKFLKSYFWDVDFWQLDIKKHRQFILTRILNYGDKKAIEWAKKKFSKNEIKKTLLSSRSLDRKSLNFWSLIFGLDKICLKRLSQTRQSKIWPY